MKITAQQLEYIVNVVRTAQLLDIQNVIIEPGKVRGMEQDQTVFIFQDEKVMSFPFGSIGLNRLKDFVQRFDLIRSTPNFELEFQPAGEDNTYGYDVYDIKAKNQTLKPPMYSKTISMSGLNTDIEYRCANPSVIKAPKQRTDTNEYELTMNENAFTMIQKGKQAMDSKVVSFKGTSKGVQLIVTDDNGDKLKYKFTEDVKNLDGTKVIDFDRTYPIDKIIPIFKADPDIGFCISKRGFLVASLNGLDIYVAPTVLD